MTLGRFIRLTIVTIIVAGLLIAFGLHYSRVAFFVVFLVVMNIYCWLDYKWFKKKL